MTGTRLPSGRPIICLITDRQIANQRPLEEIVAAAVDGGVNLVQLREKDLPTRQLLDLANRLHAAIDGRAPLLINGRLDVAIASESEGVHLPSDGLLPNHARTILGKDAIVGQTIHSVTEIADYAKSDIDYVELGTIFPSRSHPGGEPLGLFAVRSAAEQPVPVIAVGGITAKNVANVIEAGASGVAVISAIMGGADPRGAAAQLVANAAEAWTHRP